MSKTSEWVLYTFWMAFYLVIFIQSLFVKTQWTYDTLVFVTLFNILFFFRKWLKIKSVGLFLAGLGIYAHLAGFYGLYNWHYGLLGYDSITHFLSSFATAWIVFNFLIRKLVVKKSKDGEHFIWEHRLIFFLLVLSLVSLLGVVVEIIEFSGYVFLDQGDGMFFAGSGDADMVANLPTGYADTMMDIITNLLGAFFGATVFYFLRYPKKKIFSK